MFIIDGNNPSFSPRSRADSENARWGPPGGGDMLPESPDTPNWGPPGGGDMLPESPDTPNWGPPGGGDMLPESPDTPNWGPPPGQPLPPVIILPGHPSGPVVGGYCNVRFLYAAVNQPTLNVMLGTRTVIRNFRYTNVTPYYLESSGRNVLITLSDAFTGRILYRANFTLLAGYAYTISIVNNDAGISLFALVDAPCTTGNLGCVRAVNLSYNSGSVDVFLSGIGRTFRALPPYGASDYRRIQGGTYRSFVTEAFPCANQSMYLSGGFVVCGDQHIAILDAATVNIRRGILYTLYIIGSAFEFPAMQILPMESDLVV